MPRASTPQGRASHKAWYAAHAEEQRAKSRAWRAANPGRVRENNLRFRTADREKYLLYRRAERFALYGMSRADYDGILHKQSGRCAICGMLPTGATLREKTLHVDHCHSTMQARGLLCGRCNRGLGMFLDKPDLLRAAAQYLEGYAASPLVTPGG